MRVPMRAAALAMTDTALDFTTLYRERVAQVWRVVRRLGVRAADVEDAVQDVFIVAHRRLQTLRPDVSPGAWLSGIALKVAHDYRRRDTRKPCSPLEPAKSVPDDALDFALRLLEQLPSEQRDVFVLVELEQLSAPEVAEATSTALNTVYSRLRLARARFNELVAALESTHE